MYAGGRGCSCVSVGIRDEAKGSLWSNIGQTCGHNWSMQRCIALLLCQALVNVGMQQRARHLTQVRLLSSAVWPGVAGRYDARRVFLIATKRTHNAAGHEGLGSIWVGVLCNRGLVLYHARFR